MTTDLHTAAAAADALIARLSQAKRDSPEYAEIRAARDRAIEEYAALWRQYGPALHAAAREREDDNVLASITPR